RRVNPARNTRIGQKRFNFRGEEEAIRILVVVKGFFTHTISSEEKTMVVLPGFMIGWARHCSAFVNSEGEHASQVKYTIIAPLLIGLKDHPGIRGVSKSIP